MIQVWVLGFFTMYLFPGVPMATIVRTQMTVFHALKLGN